MKNKSRKVFIKTMNLIFAITLSISSFGQIAQNVSPNKLKIKFNSTTANKLEQFQKSEQKLSKSGTVLIGIKTIDALNETFSVKKIKRVFPDAGIFEAKHQEFGLHLWYELEFVPSKNVTITSCIETYNKDENIQICEAIYEKTLYNEGTYSTITDTVNDSRLREQWHYNNDGQTGGTVGADISLFEAWQIESGSNNVIVAIIDGGIDNNHVDLSGAMWVNSAEKNGTAGIDDDNNGFIDDINGFNFVSNTGTINPHSHGTHVGGTIGAVNNNNIGVCGIAGGDTVNNGVRLMSCATFESYGNGGFDKAFVYAADNGAVIAQNSWGYTSAGYYEQSVLDAIDYFIANAGYDATGNPIGPMQGGLVIFAAGNDGNDSQHYPGYYENVLSVSATNHNDVKSYYSNYGTWVDIAAPGGETYTTSQGVLSTLPYNSYGFYQGTSMACPHVSGVAALIVSKYGENGITPKIVWDRLVETSDNIDSKNSSYVGKLGRGRLNAYKALLTDDGVPPNAITDFNIIDSSMTSITLQWTATGFSADSGIASSYDLRYAEYEITEENFHTQSKVKTILRPKVVGSIETFTIDNLKAESKYWVAIKASDYYGNTSTMSNIGIVSTKDAPILSFSPKEIIHSTDSGFTDTLLVSISNIGQLDLHFSFPDYSQVSSTASSSSASLNNFGDDGSDGYGYSWKDSDAEGGPSFNWIDISSIGKAIALYDNDYKMAELPFNFPFYGEFKSEVYISSNGYLSFNSYDPSDSYNYNIPRTYTPNDIIALYWDDLDPYVEGEIYYFGDNEKFIVQYQNIRRDNYNENITCQAILYRSGKIKFQYKTVDGYANSATIGIENKDGIDGIQVAYNQTYVKNNLAVEISDASLFLVNVSPTSDTLKTNETSQIEIITNANDLDPGIYKDSIYVYSNDPLNPEINWPIYLHVKGIPELTVNNSNLDFGNSFINYNDSLSITISNTGTDSLYITDISTTNSVFSINNNAFSLYKNEEKTIYVSFKPTSLISYSDSLILTNNSDSSEYIIKLNGSGIYPPAFTSTPDSLGYILNVGDSITTLLTIDNSNGFSNLEYQIQIKDKNISKKSNSSKIGFYAIESRNSKSNNELPFAPSNISQNAIGDIIKDYNNIPEGNTGVAVLNNYAYMVVNSSDQMIKYNLETQTIESTFYIHSSPYGIAYDGQYLWIGNSSGNIYGYTLTGEIIGSFSCPSSTYNAITYNGKNFIVTETFTTNSTIYTIDYDNSIIDSKPSNISYIYQLSGTNNTSDILYSIIGNSICEIGLDNGIMSIIDSIPFQSNSGYSAYSLFSDNNYIWFSDWYGPLYKLEGGSSLWLKLDSYYGDIAAGDTNNITVSMNTENLVAGFYDKMISITSNDPTHTETQIPVHLEVHGQPTIQVDFDYILFDSIYVGLEYISPIHIYNSGTDTLKISNITSSNPDFSVDTTNLLILPNNSYNVNIIYLPSTAETDSAVLSIVSNDTSNTTYEVSLIGLAELPPQFNASSDSLSVSLYSGETLKQQITIDNLGGSILNWELDYKYITKPDSIEVKQLSNENNNGEIISSQNSIYYPMAAGDFYQLEYSYSNLCCLAIDPSTGNIFAQQENGYEYYKYKPETNRWDTMAVCPVYSNNNGGAVYLNGKIFITYASNNNIMGVYDIASDSWSTVSNNLSYTGNITTDDTYIYLWKDYYLKRYNPKTQIWTDLMNAPIYSYGYGGLSYFDGYIYAHSGNGNRDFAKYDIANNLWTTLDNVPSGATLGSAIDPVGKTYYTYGSYGYNNFYAYDLKNETWSTSTIPYFSVNDGGLVYNGKPGYEGIYLIEGEYGNGFAKYETEPGYTWLSIDTLNGSILGGESTVLDINYDASGLFEGTYNAEISFISNDPFTQYQTIPVKLDVSGAANISLSTDSIYFENAYNNILITDSLTISNYGTETLVISDISFINDSIFSTNTSMLSIESGKNKTIAVSVLAVESKTIETQLIIKSNAIKKEEVIISVVAVGKDAPKLNLSSHDIIAYAMPNQTTTKEFYIFNNGGSNLDYNVSGGEVTNIDKTSIKYFYNSGEDTEHIFTELNSDIDSLKLIVTINGDYTDNYSEYAELEIDGINFGKINNVDITDGTDYSKEFTLTGDTINQLLSDGILNIFIRNSDGVNYGYGENKNQVRLIINGVEWFNINNQSGTLGINDTLIMKANFNAENFEVGDYTTSFIIETNDPQTSSVEIPVTLKVRDQSAPIVINPLSDIMSYITEDIIEINISKVFLDVNNDNLTYSVTSSSIENIFASVDDYTTLKLKLLSTGSSILTLSARDGNFDPVPTSFSVLVLDNNAAEIVSPIKDTSMYINDNLIAFNLDNVFTDIDGDDLIFSAENSDTSITNSIINGSLLEVTPKKVGTSKITIAASDNKGTITNQSFNVSILDNQSPIIVTPINNQQIYLTQTLETVYIKNVFIDPDNDSLVYEISSIDSLVVIATLNNLEISFDVINAGTCEIELFAWDGISDKTKTSFTISILQNTSPTIITIPDMTVKVDSTDILINLSDFFIDLDEDSLTYRVFTNETDLLSWEQDGELLSVYPSKIGLTNFIVFATDKKSEEVSNWFNFIIEKKVGIIQNSIEDDITIYPNPFNNELLVQFDLEENSSIIIQIYSTEGKLIERIDKGYTPSGSVTNILDLSHLNSGVYYLQVLMNNDLKAIKKIIK